MNHHRGLLSRQVPVFYDAKACEKKEDNLHISIEKCIFASGKYIEKCNSRVIKHIEKCKRGNAVQEDWSLYRGLFEV